jgi:phosphate-selective porin OprO and OprP
MNVTLKRAVMAALTGTALMGFGSNAMADSTFDLIQALVEKGVLTEEEALPLMKSRANDEEALAKKEKSEPKMSLKNGIKWESADKANSIKLIGRLHADYRTFDYSESSTGAGGSTGSDTFDMRRARLGFEGVFSKYYKFKVQTDMSSTNKLDEAYLNIGWWKPVQFRFGQFKMPGMLEEQTSSNNIDFMERSFANAGVAGKERGAMVHGAPIKGTSYALAFSTGEGQNNAENDIREDGLDTHARLTANVAEFMGNENMVIHAGVNYSIGDLDQASDVGYDGSAETRGAKFFNVGGIGGIANDTNIERERKGLEGAVSYGPFKLQGEWSQVTHDFDAASAGTTSGSLDIDSWYAQAVWNITGESWADMYKDGVWKGLSPKKDFNPDGGSWGAWQVGLRYSNFEADDAYRSAGVAGFLEADAWTLGLNFYPNSNVRIMLNYVDTNFDKQVSPVAVNGKNVEDEKALITRVQWAF